MLTVGTKNEAIRDQWIIKTLKALPAGLTILDAGAGECPYKKYCDHLTYISQDFGQYHGDGAVGLQTGTWDNTKLNIVSDIISIPLSEKSVDIIMCTEVFEHIPDPVKAIEEFDRLLRPGGYLILTSPFASLTHFAPYHFSSGFSRFYYEHHLKSRNYTIEQVDFNGNFFEFVAQETRRVQLIAEKYTSIRLSWVERKLLKRNLKILQKLSDQDKGSSELLCFGIHVLARKSQ